VDASFINDNSSDTNTSVKTLQSVPDEDEVETAWSVEKSTQPPQGEVIDKVNDNNNLHAARTHVAVQAVEGEATQTIPHTPEPTAAEAAAPVTFAFQRGSSTTAHTLLSHLRLRLGMEPMSCQTRTSLLMISIRILA
jgi:hypothetical protein